MTIYYLFHLIIVSVFKLACVEVYYVDTMSTRIN